MLKCGVHRAHLGDAYRGIEAFFRQRRPAKTHVVGADAMRIIGEDPRDLEREIARESR